MKPLTALFGSVPLAATAAALIIAGATAAVTGKSDAREEDRSGPARVELDERPITRDVKLGTSFAPIVKKVAPSALCDAFDIPSRLGSHFPAFSQLKLLS